MRATRFFLSQVRGASEATVEKTMTKSSRKDGYTIFEKINFVERISKLSPWQRRALGIYGVLAVGGFTFGIYNDGRSELKKHFVRRQYTSDWEAAKAGCKQNVWGRFWESVFFPYTAVSNVMPYIVLGTTKKE